MISLDDDLCGYDFEYKCFRRPHRLFKSIFNESNSFHVEPTFISGFDTAASGLALVGSVGTMGAVALVPMTGVKVNWS